MNPEITREDILREVTLLRVAVGEYPSLQMLLDHFNPETLQLSVIAAREVKLRARTRPSADQKSALADRQKLFNIATGVLNSQYLEGEITLQEWHDLMRQNVKDLHITAYMIGMDGEWSDMTQADWGRVGQVVRGQYGFLAKWAAELAGGPPSLKKMDQRAGYYAAAASQSFSRGRATRVGFTPAELPAHPGDGSSECRVNCKCFWLIVTLSKSRGDYNVSWRLGNAEHCRTCRSRARSWRSLKIRAGEMVSEVADISV